MFGEFWRLYPRKIGKLYAMKCYDRAIRNGASHEEIMEGLRAFKEHGLPSDAQFIPHPSTWLNQGRWMDEYEGAEKTRQVSEAEYRQYLRERGARYADDPKLPEFCGSFRVPADWQPKIRVVK